MRLNSLLLFLMCCTLSITGCSQPEQATLPTSLVVGVIDQCKETTASAGINYIRAIQRGGHVPIVLPDTGSPEVLSAMISRCDLLFLTGGEDVDPALYAEEYAAELGRLNRRRDSLDFALIAEAMRQHKPIVGTCRGMQLINVYFGGSLYQDLPTQYPQPGQEERIAGYDDTLQTHMDIARAYTRVHDVTLLHDSRLYRLLGVDSLGVNSTHHQAVHRLADGFRVTARATDGVVEGIESDRYPVCGFQFHPERMALGDDTLFTRIFTGLMQLAAGQE